MIPTPSPPGALLCCLLLLGAASATVIESSAAPRGRPGLWEFAAKKINPSDTDYAAELERVRQIFLRQLQDPRVWAEVGGIGLMLSGWVLVVRQNAEEQRREIIAAELLAQYHNALVEARMRLEKAIVDNAGLREAVQSALASVADHQPLTDQANPGEIYLESNLPVRTRSRRQGPANTALAETTVKNIAPSPPTSSRIRELERQLSESRQREKLLEKELQKISPPGRAVSSLRARTPAAQGKEPI